MGDIADDIAAGLICSHCSTCFVVEHGHPVLCHTCSEVDKGASLIAKAIQEEI